MQRVRQQPVLALLLATLIAAGGTAWWAEARTGTNTLLQQDPVSFRDVVKKVLPAVVSVRVTSMKSSSTTVARGNGDEFEIPEQLIPDEAMRRMIEEMRRRQGTPRGGQRQTPSQFGSGVIIDSKGVVVTNNHVVAGAEQVEVQLKDGRKFTSKVIATDPKTDVAVVKLETKSPLPYLELGDSDQMEIGDRVLAVGAPFGLTGSVTHGIISGKGRSVGATFYEDYLQTDAAINPGNSGGPLINLEGKVIGINTAIRTNTGAFQGVGLAIPSNNVKEVATQLAAGGSVRRGYLGVQVGELNDEVAKQLGVEPGKGLTVGQVYADTPGAKAGLKEGDVILTIGAKPVNDARSLQRVVAAAPIGKPLELQIIRDGTPKTLAVTIEEQPADYGLSASNTMPRGRQRRGSGGTTAPDSVNLDKIGVEVTDLTAEQGEKLGYAKGAKGALVTNVEADSLAGQAGLQRGMVITAAAKHPIESAEALKAALAKANLSEGVLLLVKTPQDGSRYVVLKKTGE